MENDGQDKHGHTHWKKTHHGRDAHECHYKLKCCHYMKTSFLGILGYQIEQAFALGALLISHPLDWTDNSNMFQETSPIRIPKFLPGQFHTRE